MKTMPFVINTAQCIELRRVEGHVFLILLVKATNVFVGLILWASANELNDEIKILLVFSQIY